MFKKRDVAEMEATKQSKKGTYLKRGLITLLAVTTVASSMFALTSAFLSDKKTVTNTFITSGDVDLDFSEPSWKVEYGQLFAPGDNHHKDPTIVENKGEAYLRVKMEITDANGEALTGNENVTVAQQVAKIKETLYYDTSYHMDNGNAVTDNLDTSLKYSSDSLNTLKASGDVKALCNEKFTEAPVNETTSYFNYTVNGGVIGEGDSEILFSNVVIPSDWTKEDMQVLDPTGKGYQIKLTAEAVQKENMTDFEEAFANFAD